MRMAITFTFSSWLLIMIGVGMTVWLYPHPVAFVPYVLLGSAIRGASRIVIRAVVLTLTLAFVCVGFWFFWDAAFVHLSTLNFIPFEVAVIESLGAGAVWLIVRRIDRTGHAQKAA